MYGAMRERALASTRLAGGATALTVTAGLAVVLVLGMGGHIVTVKEDKLMLSVMPERTESPPEERKVFDDMSDVSLDVVRPDVVVEDFVYDETPIQVDAGPPLRGEAGPDIREISARPGPPTAPTVVRTAAKLIPGPPPPYPASPVRLGIEGVTGVEVCLDVRGSVTSAALAESSGNKALDDAALKWVRNAKFTPAKLDGAPQAVCGHSVSYEWKLDRR